MRPLPPSIHNNFFSSLKQVEKRLKLEHHPSQPPTPYSSPQPPPPPPPPPPSPPPPPQQQNPAPPPPPPESNYTSTESLSTPIYLNLDQPTNSSSSILQDSEPPQRFLSNSPDFPPTHEDPPQPNNEQDPQTMNGIDSIELLIQLLGLSDCKEEEQQWVGLGLENGGGDRGCDEEFLAKIVGRKGPKCGKDVERLEGWIKHFLNDGGEEKIEPLRLAHLLLGKAAFVSEGSDGFGGFEFPSTIEEFLQNDPPEE